jgi:hypothetical protein
MAIRKCRHCGNTVPAAVVVTLSDDIECPHCRTELAVSDGSRMFSSTVGFVVAGLVYWLTRNSTNILGFALPVLLAVLAFGIVSALVLTLTATLHIATATPIFEPVDSRGYALSAQDHASDPH